MSEEKTRSDLFIAEGSQFSVETSTDYSPGKESIGLAVTATGITYNGTTGNDSFTGGTEDDHLRGGDGDDWLRGGLGDDVLKGDTGNDTLNGGAGADVLEGGAGNDSLYGGEGLDSFIFAAGHGEDVITDSRSSDIGNDVLRFNGASSGSARFSREGNSLIIQAYGADDRVSVINFFVNGESSGEIFRQYSFVFDDRTLTETDLLSGVTSWGTANNDNESGWYGVDLMYGGLGNDSLSGGSGNDVLNGGAGDDTLSGGAGDDILEGGSGNDRLSGNEGLDTFMFAAGHGQDVVSDAPSTDIGNDALRFTGANSQNALFSRKGNDLIVHAYGTDDNVTVTNFFNNPETPGTVFRQYSFVFDDKTLTEPDLLSGVTTWDTEGNDNALGWYGVDLMYGGLGNDSLRGGSGNDVLHGGVGDDTLGGGAGVDILEGGSGNDLLSGNGGLDTFIFAVGHGQDVVSDAPSTDIGNDALRFTGANSQNALFSRKGNDLVVHAYGTDDNVTVTNFFNNSEIPGTAFRQYNFEFDDKTLTEADLLSRITSWGTAGNDTEWGWYGNDIIYGGAGNDSLSGVSGDDILNGGLGNDNLFGGDGADTYHFAAGHGKDLVNDVGKPGESNNTLRFNGAESGTTRFSRDGSHLTIQAYGSDDSVTVSNYFAGTDQPAGIYRQFSFVFDDATLTEADLARSGMTYNGTDAGNNASGWYAADLMYGAGGNDTLQGGGGNDVLNGGAGNDSLNGNSGEDTYQFTAGHGKDHVYDSAGSGENGDILRFTGASSGAARFSREGANLIIQAYESDDSVTVSNYFAGTDQPGGIYRQFSFVFDDATLTESDLARSGITYNGTDVGNNITGWYGVDLMNGGGGNDTLSGGSGDDVLNGGAGNDVLNGGAGQDTYLFANGHGNDRVTDYAGKLEGKDIIEFSDLNLTDLWFSKSNSNLLITESGSQDSVEVINWYSNADSQNKVIHTHDGYEIDAAQVQQLVEAMSTFAATHSELSAADQQTGFMHSVSVSSYLEAAK